MKKADFGLFARQGTFKYWGLVAFGILWGIFGAGATTLALCYSPDAELSLLSGWILVGISLLLYVFTCKYGFTWPKSRKAKGGGKKG